MKKKYFIFFVLLVLLVLILSGCSDSNKNKSNNETNSTTQIDRTSTNLNTSNNTNEYNNSSDKKDNIINTETEISNFSTPIIDKRENRQNNLRITCSKLNNLTINSNDTFSFLQTIGETTAEARL